MIEYLIAYTGPRNGSWKYGTTKGDTASNAVDRFIDHEPSAYVKEAYVSVEWKGERGEELRPNRYVIAYRGPRGSKPKYEIVDTSSASSAVSTLLESAPKVNVEAVYRKTEHRY